MKDRLNILLRFAFIIMLLVICSIYIVFKMSKTMFVEGKYWQAKADSLRTEDITILPTRGNILASDGRLMASTLPEYYLYIDFRADGVKRSEFEKYLPELSQALAHKFKDKSAQQYTTLLRNGYNRAMKSKRYRSCLIYPKKVSYVDLQEVKQFPYLKFGPNRSGFHYREMMNRVNPFGTLAKRTIGDVYQDYKMGARYGIELQYDSLLRGTPGTSSRQKMGSKWVQVTAVEPQNGVDVVTTIDVGMQDITENALRKMMLQTQAETGIAVIMEVESGEVKAITNLSRTPAGNYYESANHAVAYEIEPGSTFKTASMMIALDAGIVEPTDTFDTGNGVYEYVKKNSIRDHNWRHGGYGKITAEQAMWYSSNIATAKIILKGFEQQPEKYVDALYKMGLNTKVDLGIPGEGAPHIRHPKTAKDWSKTTLPWMSFGYETNIPPIYTLMFYNAIANGGKMIKPIFVKELRNNGETIKRFETETINSSICSHKTLKIIQQMLFDVVQKGTATAVQSPYIDVAGKTGTAQVASNGGYSGHCVSFCGYFPADNPQYSAIVVVRKPRIGYPSGGTMSGSVVREIAEQSYAQRLRLPLSELVEDSVHSTLPLVKSGYYPHTRYLLHALDVDYDREDGNETWQNASPDEEEEEIQLSAIEVDERYVPNVVGMGARDALFLVEQAGLSPHLVGHGRVVRQSILKGTKATKGRPITLYLK